MSLNQAVEAAASAVVAISMTVDDFTYKFKPVKNHLNDNSSFDGYIFETYGDELEYVRNKLQSDPLKVWTVLDCDGESVIANGYHHVNRIGYLITEVDADSQMIEAFEPTTDVNLKFTFNYTRVDASLESINEQIESAMDTFIETCLHDTNDGYSDSYYVVNHETQIVELISEQWDPSDFITLNVDLIIKFYAEETPGDSVLVYRGTKFIESGELANEINGYKLDSYTVEVAPAKSTSIAEVETIPAYTGNSCPHCGSTEMTGGPIEVDGMSAWQEVSCNSCNSTWQDVYNLAGYDNLKTPT